MLNPRLLFFIPLLDSADLLFLRLNVFLHFQSWLRASTETSLVIGDPFLMNRRDGSGQLPTVKYSQQSV